MRILLLTVTLLLPLSFGISACVHSDDKPNLEPGNCAWADPDSNTGELLDFMNEITGGLAGIKSGQRECFPTREECLRAVERVRASGKVNDIDLTGIHCIK